MNPHVQVLLMSVASNDRSRVADPIAVYPHPASKMVVEFRICCLALGQQCKYNTRCIKTVVSYADAVLIQKVHLIESIKHNMTEKGSKRAHDDEL